MPVNISEYKMKSDLSEADIDALRKQSVVD